MPQDDYAAGDGRTVEYMSEMTAEEYLLNIPVWTKNKNSLEDVRRYAEELGNPDERMKIFHVAGTNGKGSVCAYLASVLKQAGYRTGAFVSPHLVDIRERFLIDGEMVGQACFEAAFRRVSEVTRKMMGRGYCHPTFFEFLFLMGLCIFEEQQIDYLILETGLGGRLDTTNIVRKPLACIITSISLDHTEYLGDTVELIAGEKAGIIKPGVPVIFDDSVKEASRVISNRAKELGSDCYPVRAEEMTLKAAFPAPYQRINAALACRALKTVLDEPLADSILEAGISSMRWPGRMEEALPGVYLDGAHNPGGIAAFIEAGRQLLQASQKGCYLMFGVVSDKDYKKMVEELCAALPVKGVFVAHMDSKRSMDSSPLSDLFRDHGVGLVEESATVKDAFYQALDRKTENDLLFCVGSLYLIGEIKAIIRSNL